MADSDSSSTSSDASSYRALAALEDAVREAPQNYEAHLACITALRDRGELLRLRAARERFRGHFPLSGPLWLEWIADEERLVSAGRFAAAGEEGTAATAARTRILALYAEAVKDYQSVPLWLKYISCAQQWTDAGCAADVARLRGVHALACACIGRHVPCGGAVWELCREFELRLLATARPGAANDEATAVAHQQGQEQRHKKNWQPRPPAQSSPLRKRSMLTVTNSELAAAT